ncbi:conserved hypothetical protein [Cupriavidus taiwanensis]|nr:conserved hypothetical protein [Cupriavidus taiwanensis]
MPRASAVTKLRSSAQPLPAGASAGTRMCAASGGGVGMVVVRFMGGGSGGPIRLQQRRLPQGCYVGKACALETVFMDTLDRLVRAPATSLAPDSSLNGLLMARQRIAELSFGWHADIFAQQARDMPATLAVAATLTRRPETT